MQNKRLGTYKIYNVGKERYKSFIPSKLPPDPALDLTKLLKPLEKANRALGALNNLTDFIPNHKLFIYMYVRKEALLSAQIEGTQSSFSDLLLYENEAVPAVPIDDVEEVSNYVAALTHGLERLKNDFPLSLRLIREIHAILLRGGRGAQQTPGEFRKSQNWLGGTRPGNAKFVPPPAEMLPDILSDFEQFFHIEDDLPLLIKIGLIHVQFETIHPFLDGNGRLGRLLITLLLCNNNILSEPILYLSLFLKNHRDLYYEHLQNVRLKGDWEAWLEFFLEAICNIARESCLTTQNMLQLFEEDEQKISVLGRAQHSALRVFELFKIKPLNTVPNIAKDLGVSQPTARAAVNHLLELNILRAAKQQRDKLYSYKNYLDLLNEGVDSPF